MIHIPYLPMLCIELKVLCMVASTQPLSDILFYTREKFPCERLSMQMLEFLWAACGLCLTTQSICSPWANVAQG